MKNIDEIRREENEQVYQHLLAIRKIVAYKSMRKGSDKAVAELLLNGIFQFSFKDGLEAFSLLGPFRENLERFEQDATVEQKAVDMSATVIHKENRDLVRHLVAIRNIRNTKCARCDGNCLGCYLSGRENFNIGAALKLMMLYDWKAIYEVLGIGGYYDETNSFVNSLADNTVANVAQVKISKPEYETNY